jgi:hypothetical protein
VSSAVLNVQGVRELPDTEAAELFDRQARELTGLTGPEFVNAWRAGKFAETDDDNITHMIMLLPLVISLPSTSPQRTERGDLGPVARIGDMIDEALSRLRREVARRWPDRIPTKR